MENGPDLAEIAEFKARDELGLVEEIVDFAIDQVLEFVGAREVVDGDHTLLATLVERLHNIAADKPGRAGNDDCHGISLARPQKAHQFKVGAEETALRSLLGP